MAILILDPEREAILHERWKTKEHQLLIEVWDGMTVYNPKWDNDHQEVRSTLTQVFWDAIHQAGRGTAHAGANVTDNAADWTKNYRCPDFVVYLDTNPAVLDPVDGLFRVGGPDLAVDVVSKDEPPHGRLPFYEAVGTREVLIVDRYPWKVELFALTDGKLVPVPSGVSQLGFRFELSPGPIRPRLHITEVATGREWYTPSEVNRHPPEG